VRPKQESTLSAVAGAVLIEESGGVGDVIVQVLGLYGSWKPELELMIRTPLRATPTTVSIIALDI
jgi:hypothetical protein